MTKFEATLEEVFLTDDPPDVVAARFIDRDAIIRATGQVQAAEKVRDDAVHFVLEEQRHGPQRFQPDYTVRYASEGSDAVWATTDGNMEHEGRASFAARAGGGTEVRYRCRIAFDLPIPKLLAKPLRGVVEKMAQPELRAYARRLVAG